MLDWKKISNDPCNMEVSRELSNFLKSITSPYDGKKANLINGMCSGNTVLDIGAGEHDISYHNDSWEHAIYKKFASKIIGVDIEKHLCDYYNGIGFDFRCVDATSDEYLGEKFNFIYCGDVIEHVENPVRLLRFIDRHLLPGGSCCIVTPNAMFERFRSIAIQNKTLFFMSNLEHMSWISPTHMHEILRRSNTTLQFEKIILPQYAFDNSQRMDYSIEAFFEDYIYIIKKV
jgi:2-polyprenyl-3-methyl-5-hydroxy-6-metoxy-1,4-benzoquinol methylase